ncbi:Transmembrane transcriptional regulator RsiW (anti-sigma-W factor) [Cupriavidus necator]|uniref:Anti-sigma factor n=1 Tax=Cupriavidus necator (strain ATCC 17699 / DSM 428 / KCTC 22496 / NCIMB 10442 / H16 / Stanier 337) TaxID=381666 RepID=Q0K657_CUPNH|nr:anti-sigma factor [Cupriavidus necator]QCC02265.1 anti-sigma factor [Cupriavidus necator H16]QQB78330.1 anti-sigma factor [Cupriavidus necator]WKA40670.1 anti-sigma factor [Cupriavidus necator]CAJ94514.1 predicted transmembrane transcriptional regulator (anti-sigma factor) [Cupriavidus necator H16]
MMSAIHEADLHAYADGQLSGARRAAVEAYLAQHPEAAAQVAVWRRQADALHGALDPVLNEPVPLAALPPGLHGDRKRNAARTRPRWAMALAATCASVALLAVGGALGWRAHDRLGGSTLVLAPGERFAREALATHAVYAPEMRHPVEVAATEEAHLIAWLSKRLGTALQVPDLRAQGFHLIGGRLGVAEGGPSAILMYEADDGTRLSLQLRRMAQGTPDTGFRVERMPGAGSRRPAAGRDPMMAFYWIDRDLGFALAGPLERARLLTVAQMVYQQYQGG